ncbi:hypothetical protein K490DRAFT_51991 [Saccharata proteae CBS 121410]|uniref:Zn(2)-C6 fungal-type domain-containing protein n=1 Tax=Saccharata proteae CBS 121410 TaxID=1314787 RepID=A0A9P4HKM7_9PEZI|nr:hypothetical protein K490DRAFT_51991 [Saccharata proteae CBS 121410]
MRKAQGCHSCRDRHLKCVRQAGSARCDKCIDTGRECVIGMTIRFRPVTSVRDRAHGDKAQRHSFSYADSQVWVRTPSVTFAPPARTLEELDAEMDVEEERRRSGLDVEKASRTEATDRSIEGLSPATIEPSSMSGGPDPVRKPFDAVQPNHLPAAGLRSILDAHHDGRQDLSLDVGDQLPAISPSAFFGTLSALHDPLTIWPIRNREEARYFHHYVQHLGPWVDVCDENLHFGREVPRRAANYPVLSNAIMAVSARHLSRSSNTQDTASAKYMSKCLRILIPLLDDPVGVLDENLVAAIVILRLYEEMDDDDEKHHLDGGKNLLNSIAHFIPASGLGEAASWIFLRQAIYVSLTTGQPLDIDLNNYLASTSFHRDDAGSWANRMVWIFAKVLDFAFQQNDIPTAQKWTSLHDEVDAWNVAKPWHFQPLWMGELGAAEESPFPPIWMSSPAHGIGQQHYALSKIVLATSDPRKIKLGFGTLEARKAAETIILANLRVVIGLSLGSGEIPATMFHACHILCACGSYLESAADRQAAVAFLIMVEQKIAWRTGRIIAALRQQWK